MRVIFLDDSDSRWYSFQSKQPKAVRAATVPECLKLIRDSIVIDWLFLDHDLGGEAFVASYREDCGMEVVRYLCTENLTHSIRNIVVHSHNPSASQEMYNRLKDAGYNVKLMPFYNLIQAINTDKDPTHDS